MITFLPGYQFQASLYLNWLNENKKWQKYQNEKINIISGTPYSKWRYISRNDINLKFRPTPGKILNRLINLKRYDFLKKIDDYILRIPHHQYLDLSRIVYGNAGYSKSSFKYLRDKNSESTLYLDRACSHILTQEKIMKEEYQKFDIKYEKSISEKKIHLDEYNFADKIIVPSKKTYESFIDHKISKEKLIIQPLFANLNIDHSPIKNEIIKNHDDKVIVGFLGGSFVRKGLLYLLRAWDNIKSKNAILLIKSSKKNILMNSEINKILIKNDNIIFIENYINEISDFYKTLDIFCMPSIEEGFGMALLEAYLYNCKIISSEAVGASEIISNMENVNIFENRNSDQLSEILKDFINKGKKDKSKKNTLSLNSTKEQYVRLFI